MDIDKSIRKQYDILLRRVVKKRGEAAKTTGAERRAPGLGDK